MEQSFLPEGKGVIARLRYSTGTGTDTDITQDFSHNFFKGRQKIRIWIKKANNGQEVAKIKNLYGFFPPQHYRNKLLQSLTYLL